jgi:hypothetical protein
MPIANKYSRKKKSAVSRHLVEIGFIIFLFYSNLLMGEYERSGSGLSKGLLFAVEKIFTIPNFLISIASSIVGHLFFEYLRKLR